MQKTVITLIDDLDPSGETEAAETVTFALDGTAYEIDLSSENAHVLRAGLKEFIQCGRVVKRTGRRTQRPVAEATVNATTNQGPERTDPTAIHAWAIEHELREPGKRGRMPNSIKEAYAAFQDGNEGPLHELRALIRAVGGVTQPVKQLDQPTVAEPPAPVAEAKAAEDPQEAEARERYRPIERSARMADDAKWKRRTGYGNERTDKIEEWTLTERIAVLSEQHLSILGTLAGVLPLGKGNKVSHLKTSQDRLENLEFIEQDANSPHGWTITDFGKYAYEVHSMG